MSATKQRHTLTLDPDVVRRVDRLRKTQSLSSFVNDALLAYSAEVERRMYEATPTSPEESSWASASASSFIGDDDDDWEALFRATPNPKPNPNPKR
jgi:hypothetical protein